MEHVELTICARDNITIRIEDAGPGCMDWLSELADMANEGLEKNRTTISAAMTDLAIFGTANFPTLL